MKYSILSVFLSFFATVAFAEQITMTIGQTRSLGSCQGTISATESNTGNGGEQLNLVFRNVEMCSNFDIIKANGQKLTNYDSKKLQEQNQGRGGSFTIPKRLIEDGSNSIKVNLKSNSGKHSDTITVLFNAITTDPAPSVPVDSDW